MPYKNLSIWYFTVFENPKVPQRVLKNMPTFDMNLSSQTYFSQINPLAAKIASDINNMKLTYGEFWTSLKYKEKDEIINETLIRPEISLWYLDNFNSSLSTHNEAPNLANKADYNIRTYFYDGTNLGTYGVQKVAVKLVNDDVKKYRDEHSLPFSYRTKSQINFHLMETNDMENKVENDIPHKLLIEKHLNISNIEEKFLHTSFNLENLNNGKNIKLNCMQKSKNNPKELNKCITVQPESNINIPREGFIKMKKNSEHSHVLCNNSFFDHNEFSKLMTNQNCSVVTTSSSELEDEDLHCEDAKLLNSCVSLGKGFDFLKNW